MIGARAKRALAVLNAGGYFRNQLESHYHGGEKFKMRLRGADGRVVPGIGYQTYAELKALLVHQPCARSSVWPSEYVLNYYPLEAGKPAGA